MKCLRDELSQTITTSLNFKLYRILKCIANHVRSRCLRCQYKWVPELITISPPRQYYLPSKCHQIDQTAITSWLKFFMLRLAIWNTLTKKRLQDFGRLNNEEQILIGMVTASEILHVYTVNLVQSIVDICQTNQIMIICGFKFVT